MSPESTALTAAVVAVAAFVQGGTGLGFALLVAPVIGFVEPSLLPVFLLVQMIPLNLYIAWRERVAVDHRGVGWITAGRAVGMVGGLWVLVVLPAGRLNVLTGAFTVLAALATLVAPSFRPGRRAFVAAGAVTGVAETATGIGGPPLALVYQHRPAPVLRSTVALCFVIGEVLSLALLVVAGRADVAQVRTALLFLPPVALGALLSGHLHPRVDGGRLRYVVLAFALVSGVALLVRG